MKNAIIFHGTGCTPNSFWQPFVVSQLRERGYDVWVPQLPDADNPRFETWLPIALQGKYTNETVLIGHSSGGPLVLSVLENINVAIAKAILVAGYSRPKGVNPKNEPILQESYDWKKIKSHAREFFFINSDNDPWGCTDVEGRYMLDHLGGTLIIKKGEGHMGSDMYHQPYKKFPLLVKLIEL